MDETYVKVGGQWRYLYRAVDLGGDRDVIDFLLRAKRDHAAARAFFKGSSTCTACPRRSPSTRAAPTRRSS
jgi:transposase-like protein